jgi:ABC-type Zn2+ transport system substrate-binding protein/surface adhesin
VFRDSIRLSDSPTLAPTMVSAEKQLTMPPQKKSKKNTPTETDEENHYTEEDNGISFTAEPSQIIDQEIRAKLEALQKARVEKVEHTLEPFAEEEADEEDDQAIDRELERVHQKSTAASEREREIREPVGSKKKGFGKIRKT